MKGEEDHHQKVVVHMKKSINCPEDQITSFHRYIFLSKNLKLGGFLIHGTG